MIRLSQAARKMNIGTSTIVEKLAAKGIEVESDPNTKITYEQYNLLAEEIDVPKLEVSKAKNPTVKPSQDDNTPDADNENENNTSKQVKTEQKKEPEKAPTTDVKPFRVLGKIDLEEGKSKNTKKNDAPKSEKAKVSKEKPAEDKTKVADTEEVPQDKTQPETAEAVKAEVTPKEDKTSQKETKTETAKPEAKTETTQEPPTPAEKVAEKQSEPEKISAKETANTSEEKIDKNEEKTENKASLQEEKVAQKVEAKSEETPTKTDNKAEKEKPEQEKSQPKQTEQKESPKSEKETKSPQKNKTDAHKQKPKDNPNNDMENQEDDEPELIKAKGKQLKGLTVLRKIELPDEKPRRKSKLVASSDDKSKKKRPRKKRIKKTNDTGTNTTANQNRSQGQQNQNNRNNNSNNNQGRNRNRKRGKKDNKQPVEVSDKQIQEQIKATLAKLSNKGGRGGNRRPRGGKSKKDENAIEENQTSILKVTEFISANDLASLMDVSVTEVISKAMEMGMFVSINQRLDAEAITFIADEFDYQVEFINPDEDEKFYEEEIEDAEEDLETRPPIVTIMGHVDHGKTSLLDYIRKTNVTSQESGGITQHIGAYDVKTKTGQRIAFLDTPGHEAFTAMRARGAKVTDIVILVVAADDSVMPQTKEAINHAQQAGVPIVIAINKVDKPTANPQKIREELANENILVESWGGKYQDQEISAKAGTGIDELLEKVLLEAEVLELKANPDRNANGTVIEAFLDKGRGYVATVLVQAGTLRVGDVMLAGAHYGKVKAMNDHLGNRLDEAPPSTPVQVLGLDGAPQSGDILKVLESEREAREVATKRGQIMREQNIRATRGLTLEEIGRRRALGDFKELKIIIKGDVDGSVEALSDSLLKLSTPEIEVKIIHKAVGQISEADIMLASASEAIIVGFQVRPSVNARKAAEQEKVQIKLYSIIYNAINEVQDAMEGMLAPKVEEVIVGNVEVREIFKISRIGTVAGCYVTDGYIHRKNKIRLIRDGIVTYEGEIGALKRFKDDVQEVRYGFECGLSIQNFNDIKVGDVVESYEERETKRTLN